MEIGYAICLIAAVGLLVAYLLMVKDKEFWLTMLFISILGELVEGKSRKEIAAAHHITENTVKTHVTHIYEKFQVSSKDALLALVHTS